MDQKKKNEHVYIKDNTTYLPIWKGKIYHTTSHGDTRVRDRA